MGTTVSSHCSELPYQVHYGHHCIIPLFRVALSSPLWAPLYHPTIQICLIKSIMGTTVSSHCSELPYQVHYGHHCIIPLFRVALSSPLWAPLYHPTIQICLIKSIMGTTVSSHYSDLPYQVHYGHHCIIPFFRVALKSIMGTTVSSHYSDLPYQVHYGHHCIIPLFRFALSSPLWAPLYHPFFQSCLKVHYGHHCIIPLFRFALSSPLWAPLYHPTVQSCLIKSIMGTTVLSHYSDLPYQVHYGHHCIIPLFRVALSSPLWAPLYHPTIQICLIKSIMGTTVLSHYSELPYQVHYGHHCIIPLFGVASRTRASLISP